MSSRVFTAENWERLVSPQRKERMDPENFFKIASPGSKEVWADIGCGPGYFTLPLAEKVQKVYALDISREMLDVCSSRASDKSISNIVFMESDSTDIAISSDSVDKVLLVNVYHEFPSVENVIREFNRILKSGSHLFVIDWRIEPMESGPPPDHRISESQVIEDFETAGFTFAGQHEIYSQNYDLQFIKED